LNRLELARQLSAIENGDLSSQLEGDGLVIAITGPPGIGKSCLIDCLLHKLTPEHKIAVLAVDPSSSISGGALLGDRVRMSVLDDDSKSESIFVRSIATRSSSGSVPSIVQSLANHLLGNGFEIVFVETVGAGQSEMRCAAISDRIIVVEGPARGDGVQAEKAGLLELADLIVVNKCDLDGADKVVNDLTMSLTITEEKTPISKVSALTGEGIDDLAKSVLKIPVRLSSKRARFREQLFMAHESKITQNPDLDSILDRMSQEELGVEEALRRLYE
jgi:LAO/AO transport system kinase